MSISITVAIGVHAKAQLTISRLESLTNKDMYHYSLIFTAPESEEYDGKPIAVASFVASYSSGLLGVVSAGLRRLKKEHPELFAGRFGKPRNRARCRKCGTVIWSKHRHDYVTCKCGAISLDGGYDYVRRSYKDAGDFILMPEPWQQKTTR